MSDDLRVMFFGDSLVAGVGDPAGRGWVGRVAAECHARGRPITAYNLGVCGETTVQIALRLAGEVLPRLHPGADCRVVICLTSNDVTSDDSEPRIPVAESVAALQRALTHATALDLPAFAIGPPPTDNAAHNRRARALSSSFAKVCRASELPYLDLYKPLAGRPAWASDLAAGDGSHPSGAGYELLATTVLDAGLFRWLSDEPPPLAR